MHVIAPFYKGLVNAPEPLAMALITRKDPATGESIDLDQYVQLVREAKPKYPELVQDIARAAAAAMRAQLVKSEGKKDVILTSVEGCVQNVFGIQMTGGTIMEHIWREAMPHFLMQQLPMRIQHKSRYTLEEVRAIAQSVRQMTGVDAVTHDYHVGRVSQMLKEEIPSMSRQVFTPQQIVLMGEKGDRMSEFVSDIVEAAEPTDITFIKEWTKERAYSVLHGISRKAETFTNGSYNLEGWLADRVRNRA